VEELGSRMKAAEEKIDRSAMERGYIEHIQKDARDYYEKAFNTQIIMVTIIGLFVAAAGKFGVDHIVQGKLTEASANLQEEFTKKLDERFQQLENALTKRVEETEADLETKSDFQFYFAQGLALGVHNRYEQARGLYRLALTRYKSGKSREVIKERAAITVLNNIFSMMEREDGQNYTENAKKELARELYNDLEDELAQSALELTWLASLVKERKEAPSSIPK
jgi:hypothetical protein